MTHMPFDRAELEKFYHSGRFQSEPTMVVYEVISRTDTPDVSILLGTADGVTTGLVRLDDLEEMLSMAEYSGDTEQLNPNLTIVLFAIEDTLDAIARRSHLDVAAKKRAGMGLVHSPSP